MKSNEINEIVETDRLILRLTNNKDIDDLYNKLFSIQEVMQYLPPHNKQSRDEANGIIDMIFTFDKEKIGMSTLIEKQTNNIIGFAGFIPCDYLGTNDIELGYSLEKGSWGKGYATEIGKALVNFAFNNLNNDRLLAAIDARNRGSIRVIEKIGFELVKQASDRSGADGYIYSINK